MPADDELLYEVKDYVAKITINRPEVLNAFTSDVIRLMITRLEEASEDNSVRVVILTGAGRGFSAGGDVRSMAAAAGPRSDDEARADLREVTRASELLHGIPKPTIAAVNGACAGAGFSLACAADLRYAAESAVFTSAFVRVGSTGDYGGIWLASRILGAAKTRELFLLSDKIKAVEAKDIGLVAAVFPDSDFETKVGEVAAKLASFAPKTVAGMKANFNFAEANDFESYLEEETGTFVKVRNTKDAKEAARAFVEKRAPAFVNE